jgi:hypothetical protein
MHVVARDRVATPCAASRDGALCDIRPIKEDLSATVGGASLPAEALLADER